MKVCQKSDKKVGKKYCTKNCQVLGTTLFNETEQQLSTKKVCNFSGKEVCQESDWELGKNDAKSSKQVGKNVCKKVAKNCARQYARKFHGSNKEECTQKMQLLQC